MPRDVEGVALPVAEAVDDDAAQAALFVDGLLQRLRFTPVQAQVAALRDVQRLLTGLQYLVGGGSRSRAPGNKSADGRLLAPVRVIWVVLIRVRKSTVKGVRISLPQRAGQESQNRRKGEHCRDFHRCLSGTPVSLRAYYAKNSVCSRLSEMFVIVYLDEQRSSGESDAVSVRFPGFWFSQKHDVGFSTPLQNTPPPKIPKPYRGGK